jgi:hypothetical protein
MHVQECIECSAGLHLDPVYWLSWKVLICAMYHTWQMDPLLVSLCSVRTWTNKFLVRFTGWGLGLTARSRDLLAPMRVPAANWAASRHTTARGSSCRMTDLCMKKRPDHLALRHTTREIEIEVRTVLMRVCITTNTPSTRDYCATVSLPRLLKDDRKHRTVLFGIAPISY